MLVIVGAQVEINKRLEDSKLVLEEELRQKLEDEISSRYTLDIETLQRTVQRLQSQLASASRPSLMTGAPPMPGAPPLRMPGAPPMMPGAPPMIPGPPGMGAFAIEIHQ